MSSDEQSDKECPLCMEPLEIDDINFYPCKCEYQICRFCWHRLRTDENGLCPACRQPYPEDPVNFKPLTASDVQKMKTEKRQKQQQQKLKICESRKHLSSYRVLQKNLVYVVGLSARVADPETLKKPEYFGKYGRILKVAVGSSPSSLGPQSASCTAYVTYARYEDALKAIQAVNNAQLDGRIVKASLGTTKYCTNFLRSQPCHKPECMYLHDVADTEVSFTKDDMHLGRHAEYEKRLIESTFKEKNQRGRGPVATDAKIKQSKSTSIERRVDALGANVGNTYDEVNKTFQSRSPASENNASKSVKQTNGIVAQNHSCSVANCKLTSDIKSADKENAMLPQSNNISKSAAEAPSLGKQQTSTVTPLSKANSGEDGVSRSRLSEWISSGQNIAPPLSNCSVEKMLASTKLIVDMNSAKIQPDNPSQTEHVNVSCDWQHALGISSKNENSTKNAVIDIPGASYRLHRAMLTISDDDLGFDPISESAKGLADLLEEEKSVLPQHSSPKISGTTSVSSSLMSLGLQCSWPSVNISNGVSTFPMKNPQTDVDLMTTQMTNNYSCANADLLTNPLKLSSQTGQTYTQQASSAFHNTFYSPSTYYPPSKSQMARVSFSNPPANPTLNPPQQQRCSSFGNNTHYASNLPAPVKQMDGSKLHEWQEGFRALLPNVNVRFVPDLTAPGYPPSRTSPMEMQRTTSQFTSASSYDQTVPMPAQLGNRITAPTPPSISAYSHPVQQWTIPPPGFSYVSKR